MHATLWTVFLIVVPALLSPLAAADPAGKKAEKEQPLAPKFVVYASEEDQELGSSLLRVLRCNDKVERFANAGTIDKAAESDADVLVLAIVKSQLPKLEPKTLEALKKRKIVGIGPGVAQLFGQMGLEINLGHAGSNSVMLLFMGQDEKRMHWTRQDARNGETLEITASISQEDIQGLADRYWTLKVTNFGTNSPVDCKLTITCEQP